MFLTCFGALKELESLTFGSVDLIRIGFLLIFTFFN